MYDEVFSGMVACAVAEVARDKLVAALRDTNTRRGNTVSVQLEAMKSEMERASAALKTSSTREMVIGLWLHQLEHAAYGIWDMVDEEIRTNNKGAAAMAGTVQIQCMTQKLRHINETFHTYSPRFLVHEPTVVGSDFLLPPVVVGRDGQVERILDFLLPPVGGMSGDGIVREWPVFLPIFGLAGVGKTTLAQLVYNHPRSLDYYDARAWVHVSPNFDLRRIGTSIIQCLTNENVRYDDDDDDDVQDQLDYIIKPRIHELVSDGKKVLVVLDDIWEQDQQELDRLKSLLGVGNQAGSSCCKVVVDVIVTTRDEDIARRICTNKLVQPYKLHPLSDDQCWALIKQASHLIEDSNDKQELDTIGREIIATKCGGLPSVAKAFGYMLWGKNNYQHWLEMSRTDDMFIYKPMLDCFSQSYQAMSPNTRLCFGYLATLPEWHNMAEDDIIHRWIALGLIEPTNGISTGQQIISRLLDISFLQHSNLASTSTKLDNKGVNSFTMHSLIHYFAKSLMSSTLVVRDGEDSYFRIGGYCCAVLTNFDLAPSKLSDLLPARLRSLSLLGCSKMDLRNDSFSFAKYLRVLELREPSMQKLPDSICQLGLLGYLNLSGCSGLVQLPGSFGKLISVLYINLSGCSGLEQLPESFGNLTSVLHINLSGCSRLKNLPKSIVNLTSVAHISLSGCHGLIDLPKSFCNLSNLEYLDLSFCSCLRELHVALGGLTNLRHLNMAHPSCYASEHKNHLEQLKGVWEKLKKLQYLNLSMFVNPIFCHLPEGESLDCFESIFKGLSSLEHLDLSHNIFLVDLPDSLCDLSKLHTLNLSGCRRLKKIARKIAEMKCLKTIVLRKCPSLESYSFVVHADDGAYRSNLVQLEDIGSCKELEISCLEMVKSAEDAKMITLEKKRLEKLTLGWTVDRHVSSADDEVLLAELVPPQNLQRLALKGYGGNSLPAWLTSNLCRHLPNLEEHTMENIPKCQTLPPLVLLPKPKQVGVRNMASFTKVDTGELSGNQEFMFPTIDELVIQNCPNLKFGPFLPTVQRLQISACDQVMSSFPKREVAGQGKGVEASSSSTSTAAARITQLVVENCKVPLGDWSLLYHLPGLRNLEIRGSNDLTGSPATIHALSTLQSLRFYQCNGMTSLPEYLGDLTSLQELTIDGCQEIESLPHNIGKLRNLKDLHIPGCPKLQEWCESAVNKQKLADIKISRESATVEPGTTTNQTRNKQLTSRQSSLLVTLE